MSANAAVKKVAAALREALDVCVDDGNGAIDPDGLAEVVCRALGVTEQRESPSNPRFEYERGYGPGDGDGPTRKAPFDSLANALASLPKGSLWCVGSMEDGPFARLVLPQPGGGYGGGYREAYGDTPTQAVARALAGEQ